MKPLLGVNIDHVATLRQARKTEYPSVLEAAKIVAAAGADSITVHLREDRRHIQIGDVLAIKKNLTLPLNLEIAVTEAMLAFACDVVPTYVCLVPEKREELTTEGGLDVVRHAQRISFTVKKLQEVGILVSLFIDPEEAQIEAAKNTGATIVELHTGDYANATTPDAVAYELSRMRKAAQQAHQLELQVNAGHGLHYTNTQAILALPHLCELNIGHAIIARAVFVGLAEAVREMKALFVDL